jgi:hypothetical protein
MTALTGKEEEIARLNPEKIYIENVRSVLGVSAREAEQICETAARQGVFDRCVEVLCPDGVVAVTAQSEGGLPERVACMVEEAGHLEEIEFPVSDLQKRIYYRLHEQITAGVNR